MNGPGLIDRVRQTRCLLRSEGGAGVAARLLDRASNRIAPPGYGRLPLTRADLVHAAEIADAGWALPAPLSAVPGESLTVAWVCAPPRPRSGGHTTMFRMIAALERAGHTCVVYLDDRHGWSLGQHHETIRVGWPAVRAEIRDLAGGIEDAHAVFATSWETAYSVLASPARGARMYFVQDFEPWFYPSGSEALLAEATYGFGFHGVAAGRWLADLLRREYSMSSDHFDFGCDLDRYRFDRTLDAGARTGICYYARPSTPRRAFELAVIALDLFAERHPEVEIHFFGGEVRRLPFAVTNHGEQAPEQLSALYNRCIAGLTLSATNVSLVPHEMLAAGCIPVVNDAEHNRIVLDNDNVVYVPATPFQIANTLSTLVRRPLAERAQAAEAAVTSVQNTSWERAGGQVEDIVHRVVTAACERTPPAA